MIEHFPGRPARLVAVAILLPVLAIAALWLSELSTRIWRMAEVRAAIEPRYARLSGLLERGDAIVAARDQATAALAQRAYPASADVGEIGTGLQQRIRQLAEAAQLRVAGSQILPVREEQGFAVITVTGTLEGETGALAAFLAALAAAHPPIAVEKLAVQAPRARRGEHSADVTVQASMSVLKLAR
ncbi:type II secretion system protein GspM [Immundisolibacter sp.]|uniref:type II secretion system protein GspM n=1 Tax=Immundisolibacter sp. TaxID=1934948 RepID=UPI002624B65B|nr:type II secretion system protein GspM [Immundisolibacter sp.]MDD3650717.1 type II secretion system protein GspM [Immundisolibacter sp.]